jgi:hypothetical protein
MSDMLFVWRIRVVDNNSKIPGCQSHRAECVYFCVVELKYIFKNECLF